MKVVKSRSLIQQPIETMSKQRPQNEAIIDGDRKITYRELDKKANGIARQLMASGLQKQERVALLLEPSIEWVAAMLGVLKAGGVYVPLDPSYPKQRIHFCLQDSGASFVLSNGEGGGLVQHVLDISKIDEADNFIPIHEIDPSDPAYLMYTSGSTGHPKGVFIPHQSVSNHMEWMNNQFGWETRDVFLQKTSASFDASVWEFLAPLWKGARMVIHRGDPLEVCQTIRTHRVTVVQFVPSVLKLLVDFEEFKNCPSLRYGFVGGEALPVSLVEQFHQQLAIPLVNLYGPTEATIDTTYRVCEPGHKIEGDVVPIGKPIQNVSVKVVDENLQPCARGEEGELVIAGLGLAVGYHRRESLQAEKFVQLPWDMNEMGYRSGDRAKELPSGEWMFLGRIDQQIKLRGLRIELGEIESALLRQSAVKDAAVCLREGEWLTAFVVGDPTWNKEECIKELSNELPSYMVPHFFVLLERMPLLPNGKLDRNQLQNHRMDLEQPMERRVYSEWEEKVRRCWIKIFPEEWIGKHDSFFALGGDSLKALRLVSELSQLGRKIPASFVYDYSTISEQAQQLETETYWVEGTALQKREDITPEHVHREAPLSFGQLGIHFAEEWSKEQAYQIQLRLQFHKRVDPNRLSFVLGEITQRHVALRTWIEEKEPGEFWQYRDPNPHVNVQLWKTEKAFSRGTSEVRHHTEKPQFDFIEETGQLIIRMHHVMVDGWSIRLLLQELDERLQGRYDCSFLEDPSFYQFASEQVNQSHVGIGTWVDYLKDVPATSRLPQSWRIGSEQTSRGAQVKRRMDGRRYEAWQQLSKQLGVTPFSLLLTATQIFLAQASGQQDVVMGVPVANREDERYQQTIGNLVNLLPFRLQVKDPSTFSQLVKRTFRDRAALKAVESVPFEHILASIQVERGVHFHPLFQTMVVYNEYPLMDQPVLFDWKEDFLGTTKCDASFQFYKGANHLDLTLEYCTDVFSHEIAEDILDRWERNLDSLLHQPDQKVSVGSGEGKPAQMTTAVVIEDGKEGDESRLVQRIKLYWSQILGVENLRESDRFFDRGGHSLSAMKMVALINKEMGSQLSVKSIFEFPSLGEFADAVGRESQHMKEPEAIVTLQKHPQGTPVFFIHPAGGAVWCYREMAEVFHHGPVYGIQSVRDEMSGDYEVEIPVLARRYRNYIKEVQPEGPYVICGYSFGGNVAFEIACQMEKAGDEVALLGLIDCHMSHPAPYRKSEFLFSFAQKCAEGEKIELTENELMGMNENERLTYLLQLGKESGHLPDDATVDRLKEDVAMWQANNQAIRCYVMESKYRGRTLFLKARENQSDSTKGWTDRLVGSLTIKEVPGHHFSIYKGENAREVGRQIIEAMA
ncbi:non-ribosomal peptide synthetase [Marininema halotolerans]|uniref:Tyrocidine synthetase-3 n=1 Tax=Marininema halotolerans TaxID=1155944 RepID=A0A1I6U3Z0_9BACL|nr:non-ribosomal peptide synthetase [Marininema halotolerans]SFS96104.1 tyrocidine synthetase-3 [Marininema halotolerans]